MMGMNLHKDSRSGAYGVRFNRQEAPPNGKRISFKKIMGYSVYDEKEAQQIYDSLKEEDLRKKLIELDGGRRVTLRELTKDFIKARPDNSDDTLAKDKSVLKSLGEVVTPSKPIRLIGFDELTEFKAVCLGRGLSPWTVKSYFNHIKSAMSFAMEKGYIKKLPKFPKVKTGEQLPKAIPRKHLNLLMTWMLANNKKIWRYSQLSLWTGFRLNECRMLRWEDVTLYDEPEGHVIGRCLVRGKGNKEGIVPLLKHTKAALGTVKDVGPVLDFVKSKGTISRWFHKAVVKCNLEDYGYSFHGMRHTAATEMLERGYPLPIIQAIMRHSDIATTQIYAKVRNKLVEDEMAKLG